MVEGYGRNEAYRVYTTKIKTFQIWPNHCWGTYRDMRKIKQIENNEREIVDILPVFKENK